MNVLRCSINLTFYTIKKSWKVKKQPPLFMTVSCIRVSVQRKILYRRKDERYTYLHSLLLLQNAPYNSLLYKKCQWEWIRCAIKVIETYDLYLYMYIIVITAWRKFNWNCNKTIWKCVVLAYFQFLESILYHSGTKEK